MHCASQAGHLTVVKLLVESGSPTTAETSNGRTPLWFAASENKLKVVTYLIQREHDSYKLLEDRKVQMRPFLVTFIYSDTLFKKHPKCLILVFPIHFVLFFTNWKHSSLRSKCCKMRLFLVISSIVTETSLFMMLICFYTRSLSTI